MAESRNRAREAREARDRLKLYNARQEVHAHQRSRRRRDNVIAIVGVVVVAALAAVTQLFYFTAGPGAPTASPSASSTPSATSAAGQNVGDVPASTLAGARTWTGSLTFNAVKLGISLDGAAAPQAVSSVINDIQDGYYVGKTCHRLTTSASFEVIQCGSETGTGADTGYSYGPIENAPSDNVYKSGTIAMARQSGNAYSNGHQFFIALTDTSIPADAAGGYTVVGTVTSGLSTLLASNIVTAGTADGSTDGTPKTATKITAATIE